MVIDISATLRRLVLAGLPLAACVDPLPDVLATGRNPLGQTAAACFNGRVYSNQYSGGLSARIGFFRDDPRFADLYAACSEEQLHCARLCHDLVSAARPDRYHGGGVLTCDLSCDSEKIIATIGYSTATPGRRPEGFCHDVPTAPGTSLGEYWAAAAVAEGASIAAFRTLARELYAHGAPAELIARARTSARDEARHFRMARALARRYGHDVPAIRRSAGQGTRPVAELARENAVEGCVGETFAAAVALFQAQSASDALVRSTMSAIAEDEIAHAQLAFDVNAWALSRLSPELRARIANEQRRAAVGLLEGSGRDVDPDLVRHAGLPAPGVAARLAGETAAALWV